MTTLFHEFVAHALRTHPEVRWVVFVGPEQEWPVNDERVEVVRDFPANDRMAARLWADHFRVAPAARARGAAALLTIAFVPLRAAGVPVAMHLFSLHHRQHSRSLGALYRAAMTRRGLRRAALVIVNSQAAARQLGPAMAPVLVSHEGLQHERFRLDGPRGLPARLGAPSRDYLLWVGNFYAYKRAELALAAYARLEPELRRRLPFVLVGGDWGDGAARARAEARRLDIERDVRFVGWVEDAELPAIYRGARAHLMSTSEETFGRSVTEAMACGCPNLLQELPVLREVAGEAALYCDFAQTEAAGAALARICTDEGLAAQLRAAGRRRAEDFSFERLARERMTAILGALPRSV